MLSGISASDAEARGFRINRDKINADGTIDVYPQDGGKGVRTPVRLNKWGKREVYVPNWGWQECGPTCTYTVQKYGLNFWEYQTEGGLGVGYLSFDF